MSIALTGRLPTELYRPIILRLEERVNPLGSKLRAKALFPLLLVSRSFYHETKRVLYKVVHIVVQQPSVTKLLRVLASPQLAKHVVTCRLFSSAPWSSSLKRHTPGHSVNEVIVPLLQTAFSAMRNLTSLFVTHSTGKRFFAFHDVICACSFSLDALQFHYQEDPDDSIWSFVASQPGISYFSYVSVKQQLLTLPPEIDQPILPRLQTLHCTPGSAAVLLHPPRMSLRRLTLDAWDGGPPLAEQSPTITSLLLKVYNPAGAFGDAYLPYFPNLRFLKLQFIDDLENKGDDIGLHEVQRLKVLQRVVLKTTHQINGIQTLASRLMDNVSQLEECFFSSVNRPLARYIRRHGLRPELEEGVDSACLDESLDY